MKEVEKGTKVKTMVTRKGEIKDVKWDEGRRMKGRRGRVRRVKRVKRKKKEKKKEERKREEKWANIFIPLFR